MSPHYSVEIFPETCDQISEEVVREFSDHYRRIFNHRPYGQYLFDPEVGKAHSAEEVLGLEDDRYADIETLDAHKPAEGMVFWTHPQHTVDKIRQKIRASSNLVLIRDIKNKNLLGAALGQQTTLHQAFHQEEWHNPVYYSGLAPNHLLRNYESFLSGLRAALMSWQEAPSTNLDDETEIFVWNSVFTTPEGRGLGLFPLLARHLLESLAPDMDPMLALGELSPGSKMQSFSDGLNHCLVEQSSDQLIAVSTVSALKQHFIR